METRREGGTKPGQVWLEHRAHGQELEKIRLPTNWGAENESKSFTLNFKGKRV